MRVRFQYSAEAPLATVVDFHRRSKSLQAITPPPVRMELHKSPERLKQGDELQFSMWLGPFPIRWRARIEELGPQRFVDRQIEGPFRRWIHQHRFVAISSKTTRVIDEIEFSLRLHLLWTPIGIAIALGLPVMFAYRARKTRQILEGKRDQKTNDFHPVSEDGQRNVYS